MSRPNFLFFITDQQRADYLGCAGHPIVKTPNIDGLAANGTRFDRFYVASPVCMPNRASLLTGRFPSTHGLRHNGCDLSIRANTFTDVLRAGGYRTALIGKSHVQPMTGIDSQKRYKPDELGVIKEAWKAEEADYDQEDPSRYASPEFFKIRTPYYGYDHVDMVTNHSDQCNGHYYQWLKSKTNQADFWRDKANQLPHDYVCPQAVRTPIPEELYPTSFIRDRAIDYINASKGDDQPFFAFVSFPDPHHPFTPPGKYWDMYSPEDFHPRLPYEAHKNPTPPMRWLHDHWTKGTRQAQTQEAFMANERETREAMALSCGMITMIDDAIGSVINALKAAGKYENTVIVFNSDHGDYLGDFNLMLKGAIMLDSINNVSMIWSDPADRTARVSHALSSTIDLAPSIIDRAGLKPYWGIQGKSLLGNVAGSHELRDELVIEYEDTQPRMGFEKSAVVRTLITADHRLTLYKGMPWGELYDRRTDPDDTHNVWDDPAYAGVRAKLTERLVHELMENVDKSPHARRRA